MRLRSAPLMLAAICLVPGACARVNETNAEGEPEPPYNMIDPVPDPLRNAAGNSAGGVWRGAAPGEQPSAVFTTAGGDPRLRLACDERRGLVVERLGAEPVAGIDMVEIRVGTEMRRLAANPLTESAVLRTTIPYSDPIMTRLAVPEGSSAFATPDAPAVEARLGEITAALVAQCRTPAR